MVRRLSSSLISALAQRRDASIWLAIAVAAAWAVAGMAGVFVGAGAGDAGAARILLFTPPLIAAALMATTLGQGRAAAAEPGLDLEAIEARFDIVAASFAARVDAVALRAQRSGVTLDAANARGDLAASAISDSVGQLSTSLENLDRVSKATTGRIAKRAYALDAALDGVLRRSVDVFDALDERILDRAKALEGGVKGHSGAPSEAGSGDIAGIVSAVSDVAFRLGETKAGASGLRVLPEFECIIGKTLALPAGEAVARALLASEAGRLYIDFARSAGRL